MSRIASAFADGKAFVAFITCGDPDLETTAAVVRAAVENGADLIELGIPFSDPTAEGPVIQVPTCARCGAASPPTGFLRWCGSCGGTSPFRWCL